MSEIHSYFFWRACDPLRRKECGEDTSRSGKGLRPLHPCFMSRCQLCFLLISTHTSSGGPAARLGRREEARTPRAPAGDEVSCTPSSEWISVMLQPFLPLCANHIVGRFEKHTHERLQAEPPLPLLIGGKRSSTDQLPMYLTKRAPWLNRIALTSSMCSCCGT